VWLSLEEVRPGCCEKELKVEIVRAGGHRCAGCAAKGELIVPPGLPVEGYRRAWIFASM